MTRGRTTLPRRAVAGQKAFFITIGGPQSGSKDAAEESKVKQTGKSPPRRLAGNFRLLRNHGCPRQAPILEENGVDSILVIPGVHYNQKSLRSNLVM
jgi:hypothetical protein